MFSYTSRTNEHEQARLFSDFLVRHLTGIYKPSGTEIDLLFRHYQLLSKWNKTLNLTSVLGLEDAILRHYCESIFLATQLSPADSASVLDVGSGAGFPGIPLAILKPGWEFVLAESHHRKAVFLKEATRNWPHVRVSSERAENIHGQFDWVLSRAVRWPDVFAVFRRAGNRIGLLMGEEDAIAATATAEVNWQPPVRLPWGKRRVILLGFKGA